MNNQIVNVSCKNIRKIARGIMNGYWKQAIIAFVIYIICMTLPQVILDALFGFPVDSLIGEDIAVELGYSGLEFSVVSPLYTILVTGAFTLGITIFFIELIRNKNSDLGHVFSGFSYYFKSLGLMVVMTVFIVLWTLLFIIPGIIASFKNSKVFKILADDPDKGIMQCLRESKEMMKGNKWNFFFLNLSFIGWLLLAEILVAAVDLIVSPVFGAGFIYSLIICIVTVAATCGVSAYVLGAQTVFYEMANGNIRIKSNDLPPLSQDVPDTQPTHTDILVVDNLNSVNNDEN